MRSRTMRKRRRIEGGKDGGGTSLTEAREYILCIVLGQKKPRGQHRKAWKVGEHATDPRGHRECDQ